jgi:hypothetical protein
MNPQRILSTQLVLLTSCLTSLLPPSMAQGDGSILFNQATSKLINTTANVFDGESDTVTICVWVYAAPNSGFIFVFNEAGDAIQLKHHATNANTMSYISGFTAQTGTWTFPAPDGQWNAIAITHDRSSASNTPVIRVNFTAVTATPEGATPTGGLREPDPGYCVGNYSGGSAVWNGRIAHLQAFNRIILSTDELEACQRAPGSVTKDLRLWLPMMNGVDIHDRSGLGNHATAEKILTGSDGPVLVRALGATARGIALLNSGYTKLDQYMIPRFGDGSTHPAARLVGQGAGSVVQGTTYGPDTGSDPQEIVVTEDFAAETNYWTTGTHPPMGTPVPPVLQAEVRDLTIAGKDTLGDGYGQNSAVNTKPELTPASTYKDRELGLYVQSAGSLVEKVRFFHIAGTCCHIEGPEGLGLLGPTYQPFDREKTTIRDIWCLRSYRGIEITQVDTVVGNITCRALRDWGVKFSAAATQIEGPMHLFGVTAAPAFNVGVAPAPAAWFDTTTADRCWGGPWYVETSDIGMKIDSNGNVLGPIYSHACMYGNVQVLKSYNTIRDFEITATAVLSGGSGTAQSGFEAGIRLADASTYVDDGLNGLRVLITSGAGAGQSRYITDYNGPFDIAFVTPGFSTPPALNSQYVIRQAPAIDVAGQECSIINGRIGPGGPVPDGVVAVRLTNGTRQTIRDLIIFGTAGSSAPLISVEGSGFTVLNNSVIVAHCFEAGTFLELYPAIASGIAQGSDSSTTIELTLSDNFPDDFLNGATIFITDGPGQGDERLITAYDGDTDTATVSAAWSENPTFQSKYEVKKNRIGTKNYIWLTTDGTVTKKVNLPPSWDNSNYIAVDGMKVRGSITGVTAAAEAVITSPGHGLANGDKIAIAGVGGQTAVNSAAGQVHTVDDVMGDTFTIPVDTSMGTAYESGTGWWGTWEAK